MNTFELVNVAPTKVMKEIRMGWRMGPFEGHTLWFPETAKRYICKTVFLLCAKYGKDTHWIEERQA